MHRMKINRILRILNNTAAFEIKKKILKLIIKNAANHLKIFRNNFD